MRLPRYGLISGSASLFPEGLFHDRQPLFSRKLQC
jgi:hypothetical protein